MPCTPQNVGLLSLKIFDPLTLTPLDQIIHRGRRCRRTIPHVHSQPIFALRIFDTSALIVINASLLYHDQHSLVTRRRLIQQLDIVSAAPPRPHSPSAYSISLATTYVDRSGSHHRRLRRIIQRIPPLATSSVLSKRGFLWLGWLCSCASMPLSIDSDLQRCAVPPIDLPYPGLS